MKKVVAVALLVLFAVVAPAWAEENTELAFVLEMFMPPKDSQQTGLAWDTESENINIKWNKEGLVYGAEAITRSGTMFITAAGKEFYELADRKIKLPWVLVLAGAKVGAAALKII